jgi:hypothetical protein
MAVQEMRGIHSGFQTGRLGNVPLPVIAASSAEQQSLKSGLSRFDNRQPLHLGKTPMVERATLLPCSKAVATTMML